MIQSRRFLVTGDTNIYQLIYESNLDSKLEQILIGLMKDNPSSKIETVIRKFLLFVQHSTENFWITYYNAKPIKKNWIVITSFQRTNVLRRKY